MSSPMKEAYAEFCSRHLEAVSLYKELLKTDRKFHNFISVSNDVDGMYLSSLLQDTRLKLPLS